jgi:hypothetical protein
MTSSQTDKMTTQQETAWWWTHEKPTGEWLEWDYGFVEKAVTFNGKRSVTFTPTVIEETHAPTKAGNRLNNKRTDITLPNGTKTWVVMWGPWSLPTTDEVRHIALTHAYGVIRGKTPLDRWETILCPKQKWNGTTLGSKRVFLWGGCVPFKEGGGLDIRMPRRGDDVSTKSVEVQNWVERRNNLCRSITEAAFHPDRVERMEAIYGDEWDDSFHTHTAIGTGDPNAWEKRQKAKKDKEEADARRRRDEMFGDW